MSKRLPAGTVRQRADGSIWSKTTPNAKEWTQVKDGVAGAGSTQDLKPLNPNTQTEPLEEDVPRPWGEVQAKYDLDGHLPTEEIHPQHVTMDTEGNIDAKPVMMWKDAYGADKRTYTMPFHWNRYGAAHTAQKQSWDDFQLAHQNLHDLASGGSHAAMAALVSIATGRSPEEVCKLHHERVETTNEGVEKGGDPADRNHPDRVQVTFKHPRGHAYTAHISNPVLARHAASRKATPSESGAVFDTSPKRVRKAMEKAGVDPDSQHLRHHVATHFAVDALSKTPPLKAAEHGIGAIRETLQLVSDKMAQHFGHDPAPEGMSYVPPGVQLAYLEECGGHKMFPLSYAKLKGEAAPIRKAAELRKLAEHTVFTAFGTLEGKEPEINHVLANLEKKRVAKGKSCSQTEPDSWFNPLMDTPSTPEVTPPSTPPTTEPKPSTPGPSAPSSVLREARPDPVLEKAERYLARLTVMPDEYARYLYEEGAYAALLNSPHFNKVVTPGARFRCAINGVDGFLQIEERDGNGVTISHSGTGMRGRENIDNLKDFLLKFHKPVEPTAPEPEPEVVQEISNALVAAIKTAVTKGGSGVVLSDIGSRQPASHAEAEEARGKYLRALRDNLTGHLDDGIMREINAALYERNYARINELVKASSSAEKQPTVSSPTTTSSRSPTSNPAGNGGERGLPLGTHTSRKDGEYEKVGKEQWKHVPSGKTKEHKDQPEGNLTLSDLRDLLAKLRSQLHNANRSDRAPIKERIESVKRRIQHAHSQRESVRKSATAITSLEQVVTEVNDPMESWLRKSEQLYDELDRFIIYSDKSTFSDFAIDLVGAPVPVRTQSQMLRMQKGDSAIHTRWNVLRGGE